MKLATLALALTAGAIVSLPAQASDELAKKHMCLTCHTLDKKLVGPSYHDVAAKYKGDKAAETKLFDKVKKGGVGVWGQIPMPANPQVSADEATTLVKWLLTC